jgi:hypothetical protein
VLEAKQGANDGDAKAGHGIRGSEGWGPVHGPRQEPGRALCPRPACRRRPPDVPFTLPAGFPD